MVAWPTRDGREGQKGCGRECTPCTVVQRLAERAQAQRRGLQRRRTAVPFLAQVQQVGATSGEEADDDGCQVLRTDGEESDDADAALVVPGKHTDVAVLGAGEGWVALPKAFSNDDVVATHAKDPNCLRYMPLVNKPRAQWPPHLAAAPVHFLYVASVLCVQVDDVFRREIEAKSGNAGRKPRSRRTPPSLGRPRILLSTDMRTNLNEPLHCCCGLRLHCGAPALESHGKSHDGQKSREARRKKKKKEKRK